LVHVASTFRLRAKRFGGLAVALAEAVRWKIRRLRRFFRLKAEATRF
jgi:hypothetical protein